MLDDTNFNAKHPATIKSREAENYFSQFASDKGAIDPALAITEAVNATLKRLSEEDRNAFEKGGGTAFVCAHVDEKARMTHGWTDLRFDMLTHCNTWEGGTEKVFTSCDIDDCRPMWELATTFLVHSIATHGVLKAVQLGRS